MFSLARHRAIAQLWDWLPAFRAVAEYESVNKAAVAVAISPSALSRSVRLLEEALGSEVFNRHSSGLTLTPLGQELLTATRDSMRRLDDVVAGKNASEGGARTPLKVGVTNALADWAARKAVLALAHHDAINVVQKRVSPDDAGEELLRGNMDVVLCKPAQRSSDLAQEAVGVARWAVFSPSSAAHTELEGLRDANFVGLDEDDTWPYEIRRNVRITTHSIHTAAEAAVALQCYVVLPKGCTFPALNYVIDLPTEVPLAAVRRKLLEGQQAETLEMLIALAKRHL
jgi:DNA-binding transcriptional LysR family regulator